ncbi:hypothetical protein [Alicyclobacillus sacchari]|uniref:hypothetical protein n=1 Tax=Alicyclobacillus sacchari TaxID=392010 RepID=UPI0024E15239|nr:hypothetical protein [Alicyclobacillus sacchari]
MLHEIVAGLAHLHETGYAFCDVKAQNILVDSSDDMRVRFVDAGVLPPWQSRAAVHANLGRRVLGRMRAPRFGAVRSHRRRTYGFDA